MTDPAAPRAVLLVEDDPVTAELARRGLVRAGFAPCLARSLEQAMRILPDGGFVAVLVDYNLPDGDAWDLVTLVRGLVPRIPAIVVTAMGSEAVAAEAVVRGVAAYLTKNDGFADQLGEVVERAVRLARAEEEMRHNALLLREIADHAHDVIVLSDGAGTILFASAATEHMLGVPADILIGQKLENFIHPEDRVAWQSAGRSGPRPHAARQIFRCQRHDGHVVSFEPVFVSVGEGSATRTLGVLREVTERLRLEERVRHQERMEALGQLTGGLAHDFNNLLGVMIGNLDLLSDRLGTNPAAEELARGALDAALLGAELTGGLLAFARRQELRPVQMDVNAAIRSIVRLVSRPLGLDGRIELRLADLVWPVSVDRAQFETAITNLTTNARDAMPQGGCVTITTSNLHFAADDAEAHAELVQGDYATVEVTDTGSGMPAGVLGRIFEPFFTTKEQGRGTGLGLAMVFGFIKQSGGHISAHSTLGHGTTFRLHLPRATAPDTAMAPVPLPPLLAGDGRTILLVEDNANLRQLTARQLSAAGYRVMEAENGPAALRVIETTEGIDLVFTDIVMPGGLSGYDTARLATALRPGLKALLTSGFPDPDRDGPAPPPGPHRVLQKPYRTEGLLRAVRAALDC